MSEDALIELDDWLRRRWGVLPPPASPGSNFKVSVIIPTHRQTPIGLQAFREQDCEIEVIVLANGAAKVDGDRVHRIKWAGHGATRQAGVALATGDYVLFSVDDALPRGQGCVRTLVEALEQGGFDAVMGRQLPWPHSDSLTQERLAKWTPSGTEPKSWPQVDHVFALYRRQTLLDHPLPNVPIAEDLHWSRSKHIGYVPTAPVVHAHSRTPKALYARSRALHVEHCRLGEPARVPNLSALLRALPGAFRTSMRHGPREFPNQIAELLGQWHGAVEAQRP
jgi:hypothetical protein